MTLSAIDPGDQPIPLYADQDTKNFFPERSWNGVHAGALGPSCSGQPVDRRNVQFVQNFAGHENGPFSERFQATTAAPPWPRPHGSAGADASAVHSRHADFQREQFQLQQQQFHQVQQQHLQQYEQQRIQRQNGRPARPDSLRYLGYGEDVGRGHPARGPQEHQPMQELPWHFDREFDHSPQSGSPFSPSPRGYTETPAEYDTRLEEQRRLQTLTVAAASK